MKDTRYRSLVKTISWRVIAVTITTTVTYVLTRNVFLSASVGSLDSIAKLFFYYVHERTWENVKWGRILDSVDLNQKS
ncbi:MAG: DUF2061 domain-containing protein [Halobacteriota archaeon]|nr:DUF2061 domain-containing protein [Halobacteriota archaeon]